MNSVRRLTLSQTEMDGGRGNPRHSDLHCAIPLGATNAAVAPLSAPAQRSPAALLQAGISLARAGDMSRRRAGPARARLFERLSIDESPVFALTQVHSRRVLVLDGQTPRAIAREEADGMVTTRADAVLTVTVADCLPIFLVDPATGAFGLVHSGWKGTGIVGAALEAMTAAFGTDPRDVSVTLGPGIGPCCYRVSEERARSFAEEFGGSAVARGADGTPRLDLRIANVTLLQAARVREIAVVEDCTCCTPFLSSFRRQGADAFTLMLAFIRRG
jgi:polyphenol oxidase